MEKTEELIAKQIELEEEAKGLKVTKEYNELIKAINSSRFDETRQGSILMKLYFPLVRAKIEEYFNTTYYKHTAKTQKYIYYLCDDLDKLTYLVLQSVIQLVAAGGNKIKLTRLASLIMKKLKEQKTFSVAEAEDPKLIAYLGHEFRRASKKRKRFLIDKHMKEFRESIHDLNRAEDIRAGTTLVDIVLKSGADMIQTKRMNENFRGSKASLYVVFTTEVFEVLKSVKSLPSTAANFLPMVAPPKDWTHFNDGGYYTVKHPFMKVLGKTRQVLTKEDFSTAYKAVNNLQKTAWRVNKRVYDIVTYVYDNNMIDPKSPKELPRLYGDLPTSELIVSEDIVGRMEYKEEYTKEERKAWGRWNKRREEVAINLDGEMGRRLQYLMTIGVAERMLDYDRFYYAYQLDYRGRVYPISDFFTPQSKGYTKAMLEFADGEYLTDEGVYWLKIHIANCYGLDKAPFEDRIKWVEEHRLKLVVVGNSPMEHLSFWSEADSPYEFVAGCIAYADYIAGKEVHLPIQLDAVNSGVQMYSGLLRDRTGAEATCVVGKTRSDLYQQVADVVNLKLKEGEYEKYLSFLDKEGVSRLVPTTIEAKSLEGKVTRSMVKRNVMTLPYSVTYQGMKEQNWEVMKTMKLKGKDFWKGDEWVVNTLLTTLISEAINEVVKAARKGQEYLKEVTKLQKTPTMWHTPIINLPVYQAMFDTKEVRVKTVLGSLVLRQHTEFIKRSKQLSSVAANYIHSIDATVLMYIALHINSKLGVIHDCFLVHPNSGKEVRDLYKDGYVKIMKSDPLKRFSEELDKEGEVEIPYINDLDLDEVYDSEYIIS